MPLRAPSNRLLKIIGPDSVFEGLANLVSPPHAYSRITRTPIRFDNPDPLGFSSWPIEASHQPDFNRITIRPELRDPQYSGPLVRHESTHALLGKSLSPAVENGPMLDGIVGGLGTFGYNPDQAGVETPAWAAGGGVPGIPEQDEPNYIKSVLLPAIKDSKARATYLRILQSGGKDVR